MPALQITAPCLRRPCPINYLVFKRAQRTIFLQIQVRRMTNVLRENLWNVRQQLEELRLQIYSLFLVPSDVVVHRHEDAILEIFRQNLEFFRHHVLDFSSCIVVRPGKIFHSNSTGSPSILSRSREEVESRKQLNFVRPRFYR